MSTRKHCKGTGIQNARARGAIGGRRKADCRSRSGPQQAAPKREPIPTLHSKLSDAALCRANGWRRGTVLRGANVHDSTSVCTITLTAIGEVSILAKCVEHGGDEWMWTLRNRAWKPVKRARGVP